LTKDQGGHGNPDWPPQGAMGHSAPGKQPAARDSAEDGGAVVIASCDDAEVTALNELTHLGTDIGPPSPCIGTGHCALGMEHQAACVLD
jgi:hypothetical protein